MESVRYIRMKAEMNTHQAAEYLGVQVNTLYNWIQGGIGPTHIKRFGRLYFRKEDLDAYLIANTEIRKAYS